MSSEPILDADIARRAAARLSRRERHVLALSAGQGRSVAEIAAGLGLTSRQAERLLARAIASFDRALDRECRREGIERR